MKDINQFYDEIILSHQDQMRDAICYLENQMERRLCKFGDVIFPTFLKPFFLSGQHINHLTYVIRHVMNILEKTSNLYFSHPELRDYYYLEGEGAELMRVDHGYSKNIVVSRPDSFFVNGTLRFVEFNCDSPAGPGYCDVEEEIMVETFPLKEIQKIYRLNRIQRGLHLFEALLGAYKEFAGNHRKPNIAIVDWREMKTQNEFLILQQIFKSKGCDTIVADPRDLRLINGRLEVNGFVIDLVYRRVIFRELMERLDQVKDFIDAYKKNRVCVVNPLRSRLASNKALLSIITNPRLSQSFYSEEENRIIQKHIPWTRRLIDIQVHFENNLVFLKNHVLTHRESLVLKPADSYGGRDVVIGCETAQSKWAELVTRILRNNEDWVVQKYVDISKMTVPLLEKDMVRMAEKKYNLNPFVFGGEYAGCMARLSDQSVINVTAGGGMIPAISFTEKQ